MHSEFLIEAWKPNAPSIVVFKDPNCGYCIKALQNLERYQDFNVFMFWSPILGASSVAKVNDIFECSDPLSLDVFSAVVNRQPVLCNDADGGKTLRLRTLNDAMISNYDPNSVPSYYFGGQRVNVSSLERFQKDIIRNIMPVQLDWSRYEPIRIDQQGHQGLANAIVFMPASRPNKVDVAALLKNDIRYNWYIAGEQCEASACDQDIHAKASSELRLLLNVTNTEQPTVVINGMVIQPERYAYYLHADVIDTLQGLTAG
nr:thioredoxin fold domain-containing protein [Echinimonas agarilytica]